MSNDRLSRRNMLKAAGAAGVASAGLAGNATASMGRPAAHRINANDFALELGSTFKTQLNDSADASLKLADVQDLPAPGARPSALSRRSAFVARFEAPEGIAFKERIYQLRHPRLGRLDLLLQPVVDDKGGAFLEAVFN